MSDSASKSDAEVKNEEPKEEKKEAKKKRPASSRETVDEDIPLVREPRQRKQTAFFQTEISSSNDRPVIIEKGPGTELGEIENVKRRLDSTKVKEPFLKLLHRVLFPGSHPREATVKKNIAKFSGFATKLSEKDREKLEEKLEQNELKQLKNIADLLDIEHSGKKADVVTRIVDFLHKPVSSGKEFRAKKKTSSSSSSSKSAKKDGSSRGPSAYILFTQDYRQKIKDKHPDATFAELGKLLGQKWGSLSEAEKDKYKEKAGGEPSKKKQKSSKPAKKRSHDDDEEEEEEEESEEEKKPAKKKQKAPAKKESKEKEAKEDKPGVKATEEQKTQMQAKVRELLKDQDLYKYTMGLLKKDLAKDFPVDVITGEKEWLKNLLKEEISKAKKSE